MGGVRGAGRRRARPAAPTTRAAAHRSENTAAMAPGHVVERARNGPATAIGRRSCAVAGRRRQTGSVRCGQGRSVASSSAPWSSVEWSCSQRRQVLWSGRRDATSAQKRGPWPKTRRCASSWMTTVSSASGGARIRRHENASRPWRDALPQRVRWSRMRDRRRRHPERPRRAGAISRSMAVRAPRLEPRLEDGADRSAVGRRDVDDDLVLVGAADPLDRRAPEPGARRHEPQPMEVAAEPDRGAVPQPAARGQLGPIAAPAGRGAGAATARARRGRRRRDAPGRAQPRRPAAGTVTTTPRSGWMTTRRPRDRGERRRV